MWRFTADLSAVRNTEQAEKKSKLCRMCFMTVSKCIIKKMETRTIYEQSRLKLCQNLRTTSLGQNLLVLIKKACIAVTKRVIFSIRTKHASILSLPLPRTESNTNIFHPHKTRFNIELHAFFIRTILSEQRGSNLSKN